ncbi:putative bifunctional diguanylate cyclase/phosphodiesterase [Streptomyces abyssomicinicus]|uniref:putative bifunctional diguanylate cyclase/phosphodiesterase n=1 Tax=Streptomyces abyssomicinicus TaxID=574929 RepID=UPI00147849C2|nr:EAL domain-containing protein [Streptomyces abyssomicinicus]
MPVPLVLLTLVCAGYALGSAVGWGSHRAALVMGDFGLSAAGATAAVSCFLYARRQGELRPAWLLFAFSSAMASMGNLVWGWYEVVLRAEMPRPSLADFFFLCFAPPAILGLLMLARRPLNGAGWVCLVLDAWLIGGSLLTLSWSLALGRTAGAADQGVAHAALQLAYPILDIALVSVVLALHFRRTAANRAAVNAAVAALALTVVCDAMFTSPLLHQSYRSGQLLDAGWFAGSLLLAYAPWAATFARPREGRRSRPLLRGRRFRRSAGTGRPGALPRPGPAAGKAETPAGPPDTPAATPRTDPVRPRPAAPGPPAPGVDPGYYAPARPIAGSLAALLPYLAAAVCTLGILYNVLAGRSVDQVVLLTAGAVVLALLVRQGIMLLDNMALTEKLAENENHFRSLVQGSSDVIMIAAPNGRLKYVSDASEGVYGLLPEELVGRELAGLIHPEDLPAVLHELRRFLAAGPPADPTTRIEYRFRSGDGGWLNVESTVNRHQGGLILNSRDVTERVRLQAQLQHSAEHDALTDLPNRALFTRRVGQALSGRRQSDQGTAVLFIDLDGFKAVNDTIGHQAGDELLVQAARRLQEAVRQGDTAARLGGDEFAALILGDGVSDRTAREGHILELADRLRLRLSQPYEIDGNDVRVAASIGVAFAEPGLGAGELLRNADLAMYRAKAAGKDRVELYAPQMQQDVVRRAEVAARLRNALHEGEFTLLHQPMVSLADGRITAVSAQARWRSAQGALFTPAEFLRAAEEGDRTAELGRWVLEEAVVQAADRSRAGLRTPVAVRIAARRLLDRSLPLTSIEALLTRHGLAPGSLMIELAGLDPSLPLDDLERRLTALRRLGVRFALDGFGTGYGSITALRRLPVEVLKLDRSLVEGVVESARLHKITSGLLRIAGDLGMQTVAEGVDLPDQAGVLRAMGCTHGMGGAFSAPLDEYRIRRLLADGHCPVPAGHPRPGGTGGRPTSAVASRGHAQSRPGGAATGPGSGAGARPPVPPARSAGAAYAGLQHGAARPHSETVVPPP